jgi:AbrB family looped-hinge helix DNA binding protein
MADATLTAKGQTTIPKEIRERLGLEAGDKLTFTTLSDGTVVMRAKTRRLLDLAGSLTRADQPAVGVDKMKPLRG